MDPEGMHMLTAAVSNDLQWYVPVKLCRILCSTRSETEPNILKPFKLTVKDCNRMQKRLQMLQGHKETPPADRLAFGLSEEFFRKAMKGVT
jgi:hypothetical protein